MTDARLSLDGREVKLPVVVGTEAERGIDISNLRSETGAITLDLGYGNTGACKSAITYIDGEKGILRYRGYPIEQLAEHTQFTEVAYLLINGDLPNRQQYAEFRDKLTYHSLIHEDMKKFYEGFPAGAHPMAILSSMIASMSTYYPNGGANTEDSEHHPRAGQGEDHRGLLLQEVGRPAVHLSAERSAVLRELSAHDVRLPDRAVHRAQGGRKTRSTSC